MATIDVERGSSKLKIDKKEGVIIEKAAELKSDEEEEITEPNYTGLYTGPIITYMNEGIQRFSPLIVMALPILFIVWLVIFVILPVLMLTIGIVLGTKLGTFWLKGGERTVSSYRNEYVATSESSS